MKDESLTYLVCIIGRYLFRGHNLSNETRSERHMQRPDDEHVQLPVRLLRAENIHSKRIFAASSRRKFRRTSQSTIREFALANNVAHKAVGDV
jgi:hypothetical protein